MAQTAPCHYYSDSPRSKIFNLQTTVDEYKERLRPGLKGYLQKG